MALSNIPTLKQPNFASPNSPCPLKTYYSWIQPGNICRKFHNAITFQLTESRACHLSVSVAVVALRSLVENHGIIKYSHTQTTKVFLKNLLQLDTSQYMQEVS